MERLKVGDTVLVPHTENYPYEQLPDGAHFEHWGNAGNEYDGLRSVLVVVPDEYPTTDCESCHKGFVSPHPMCEDCVECLRG